MTEEELDLPCGRHLSFRDLVHAGETWRRVRVPNLPQQPETVTALRRLAENILDPLIDEFGPVNITYGFASLELTKHVPGRIEPSLDQHAGHEVRINGKLICSRLGQAVDFNFKDRCSGYVGAWIVKNCSFDRIYFYGTDRPLHVSMGHECARVVVSMSPGPSGKRIPQWRTESWLQNKFAQNI